MSAVPDTLFADLASQSGAPSGVGLPWLDARRKVALATMGARGVPHRRIEEWKYSDLRTVLKDARKPALLTEWCTEDLAAEIEAFDFDEMAPGTEVPEWIVRRLGTLAIDQDGMAAASLALLRNGAAYRVPRDTRVAEPVTLKCLSEGHARLLIVLEEGAELTLLEEHSMSAVEAEGANGFYNIGTEIFLGPRARLNHVRIGQGDADAIEVEHIAISVAEGARYLGHYTNFGARLSRVDVRIVLAGQDAQAHLSGVDVLSGSTHSDVTTYIDHAVGNTTSTQLFKKVAGGKARSIYQGKVTVQKGADGSDSRQTAKGLLLSERAEIDLKPELEIFADDVKCAHGAAVGDLDDDSLFYLRARGVPEAEARNLLVHAFVADAVNSIADETLRAGVLARIEEALRMAGAV